MLHDIDVTFELKEMGAPDLISIGGPTYVSTYNYTPFSNDLTIDPILSIVLTNPLNFTGDESYDVEIKDTQVSFTSREVSHLCQGRILDKEVVGWSENINFKFALQDIGYDMINEILKRSPLFGDLVGSFLK
jgi:hypothetical protein